MSLSKVLVSSLLGVLLAAPAFAACDEGRVRGVLRWVLVTSNGDDDFRSNRDRAIAGATRNQEGYLVSFIAPMLDHDKSSLHATRECARDHPGSVLRWAREILGLPA